MDDLIRAFVRDVKAMRASQMNYFKTHAKPFLTDSIRLERVVDGHIIEIEKREKAGEGKIGG